MTGKGTSTYEYGANGGLRAKCVPARVADDNEHINYRTICGVVGETSGCGWMGGWMGACIYDVVYDGRREGEWSLGGRETKPDVDERQRVVRVVKEEAI